MPSKKESVSSNQDSSLAQTAVCTVDPTMINRSHNLFNSACVTSKTQQIKLSEYIERMDRNMAPK